MVPKAALPNEPFGSFKGGVLPTLKTSARNSKLARSEIADPKDFGDFVQQGFCKRRAHIDFFEVEVHPEVLRRVRKRNGPQMVLNLRSATSADSVAANWSVMATKKKGPSAKATAKAHDKRVYFKQADFPLVSLQQAQRIASALVDNFGGREGSPPDIALSMSISPTSSAWQPLAGSAVAYGITEGGVNANAISLTQLGRRLVSPEAEGEDVAARREAIFRPRLMKEFFEKYRRAKFPSDIKQINGTFGQANGDRGGRVIQLALRVSF